MTSSAATTRSGASAPPQRAASHISDCARVRSSPRNQFENALVRFGKQPASPTPNMNRTVAIDQKPVARPVAMVKADHQTTIRVMTARGPIRSPSQPPGTSKIRYASEKADMTVPIAFLVSPSSALMADWLCEMHTRSR